MGKLEVQRIAGLLGAEGGKCLRSHSHALWWRLSVRLSVLRHVCDAEGAMARCARRLGEAAGGARQAERARQRPAVDAVGGGARRSARAVATPPNTAGSIAASRAALRAV